MSQSASPGLRRACWYSVTPTMEHTKPSTSTPERRESRTTATDTMTMPTFRSRAVMRSVSA